MSVTINNLVNRLAGPRKLCALGILLISGSLTGYSQPMVVDAIEYSFTISPAVAFYGGQDGTFVFLASVPEAALSYRKLSLSVTAMYGEGVARAPLKYNGGTIVPLDSRFAHLQFEARAGMIASKKRFGMVIPYLGFSLIDIRSRGRATEASTRLFPDFSIGVSGVYDLNARFGWRTTIMRRRILLKHFLRSNFEYTLTDRDTTGQPRTQLPRGIVMLGIGWGAFISPQGR